jgi:predicted TIM-barrel fold metal-dependent hydrolase
MTVIDADTHVDESEETWSYLQPGEESIRPLQFRDPSRPRGYWLVDGVYRPRTIRDDAATRTTVATRELVDIDARLRDMDAMGVDIQVVYPTFFNLEITERPDVDLALRRSYNRWMAERCSRSHGRLRWILVPPLLSMDAALEELRFGKDHGACGILKKGDREAGNWPAESYFFPLYQEAQRLDLPICFHVGTGSPELTQFHRPTGAAANFYRTALPVVHAFQSLITLNVPAHFPTLRWGFIEANASWVPGVLYNLRRTVNTTRGRPGVSRISIGNEEIELTQDVLASNRLYVSCQVDEDFPYILRHTGVENLLIGSDYSHNDFSVEPDFLEGLRGRAAQGDLPEAAVRKITCDNPRAFYGL